VIGLTVENASKQKGAIWRPFVVRTLVLSKENVISWQCHEAIAVKPGISDFADTV
jgi:hypothetical protein